MNYLQCKKEFILQSKCKTVISLIAMIIYHSNY
jgi:hypothetical protein